MRKISDWRDAECLSAVMLVVAGVLGAARNWLPVAVRPRCLLKTWTGVPCCTCGATRALKALLHGHVAAALRLQPLVSVLAMAAILWMGYACAGALLGVPRVRVQITRREKTGLLVLAAVVVGANWVYLVLDGR